MPCLLSPLFLKDARDAVMVGEIVRIGGDHSYSWSQMFSICQNFFLDQKCCKQDQLDRV